MSARTLLAVVGLTGALVTGCKTAQRAECDLLVDTANRQLDVVAEYDPSAAPDPEQAARTLHELARAYDGLGRSVGALTLSTPDLAKHARSYQRLASSAAATTRVLAGAVQQRDAPAQRAAEEDFARLVKEQQTLVAEVNAFCAP